MKTHLLLIFLCLSFLPVNAQDDWKVGAKAGMIGVPYAFASGRMGTGMLMGLYLDSNTAKATNFLLSLNYRKVDNLLKERLLQSVIVLPDGLYRGSELLSISGFAGLNLGLRADRVISSFRNGQLKVSIEGGVGLMTVVRARLQSDVILNEFDSALIETGAGSFLSGPSEGRFVSSSRVTEDEGKILFSGGMGMVYEFAAGFQFTGSVHIDLNDRFSQFAGTSDAKLTQVLIGFNYPFSSKTK